MVLTDRIDVLYRAAWALSGSRYEAEDLVQETFAQVLKRPRLLRSDSNVGYLLRALRNTHIARHRAAMAREGNRKQQGCRQDRYCQPLAAEASFDASDRLRELAVCHHAGSCREYDGPNLGRCSWLGLVDDSEVE